MSVPLLELRDVSVRFGSGVALDGVSLTADRGDMVALLGPNGSGKTTLLRAALGLIRTEGDVLWRGDPVSRLTPTALSRCAGYLQQQPTLDGRQTVRQTIAQGTGSRLGLAGVESEAVAETIESVARDLDLMSMLDRRLETLSGGQRQRAALGRSLAQRPALLLLDEPTTFIDLKHQLDLLGRLRRLCDENRIGVVLTLHDVNQALAFADRVVLLSSGRVRAGGGRETIADAGLLGEVFGVSMTRVDVAGRAVFVPGSVPGSRPG
jgi:iron complex transport system ATP-binding protein